MSGASGRGVTDVISFGGVLLQALGDGDAPPSGRSLHNEYLTFFRDNLLDKSLRFGSLALL